MCKAKKTKETLVSGTSIEIVNNIAPEKRVLFLLAASHYIASSSLQPSRWAPASQAAYGYSLSAYPSPVLAPFCSVHAYQID